MRKPHGFPIAIAIAAARNGHRHRGAKPEEPGRHERDFHRIMRWKANSAQVTT
jgi:hypothetical protein